MLFPLSLIMLVFLFTLAGAYVIDDPHFMMGGLNALREFWPEIRVQPYEIHQIYILGSAGITLYTVVPILVGALVWMGVSYWLGDKMMLKFAQAQEGVAARDKKVYQAVENVAIMAGLPMPKVYIMEDSSLNAFATGRSPQSASIALTRGLIDKLDMPELEAVIGHEMAHIQNRDIRLSMLIVTGLGVFGFLANAFRNTNIRMSRGGGNSKEKGQAAIVLLFVMMALMTFHYLVAPIIRLAVSRTREYAADAQGALLVRNPQALASALKKIAQDPQVEAMEKERDMAAVFIADPIIRLRAIGSTHPPVEERIRRLESM